jgi:DHA2 family multidrug resistance protein-like MFS transporter
MAAMQRADGLPVPRRYWSVLTIWLAIFMAVLDSAIANVALPTIARELHTTPAGSVWVINAYQIAIVVALLPLGSLGEVVGYRRVYQGGLAVFIAASLGCALAQTLPELTLARVAQGLGAAGIMSMNGALVRFTYPERQMGRGIGLNAVVIALAAAIGPTVASAILAVASWQWLFAVNIPIGALGLAIGMRALPHVEPSGRGFDAVGAILNAVAFGLLLHGLESLTHRATAGLAAAELVLAALAGVALARRSLASPRPLVPLDLLRHRPFALAVGTSTASFIAQSLAFVSLPFLLQYAFGRSQVETGVLMTPWPVAVGIMAPFAGRMADRLPAAVLCGAGMLVMAAGMVLLAVLPDGASGFAIGWRMALCGVGFGLFQSPNARAILTSAPPERSGGAGGAQAMARLLGQTLGATLAAFLFTLAPTSHAAATPLLIAAGFAVAAALGNVLRLKAA